MKTQIENLKKVGETTWKLFISPEKTWNEIAQKNTSAKQTFNTFVLPWICACALASIVGNAIWPDTFSFSHTIAEAIFVSISLLGAYFASMYVLQFSLRKIYEITLSKDQAAIIVATTSCVIYAIKTLAYLFPALNVLFIFSIYTTYLLWTAADFIVGIDENNRGKYLLVNTISIILMPWVFFKILTWLTPNIGF